MSRTSPQMVSRWWATRKTGAVSEAEWDFAADEEDTPKNFSKQTKALLVFKLCKLTSYSFCLSQQIHLSSLIRLPLSLLWQCPPMLTGSSPFLAMALKEVLQRTYRAIHPLLKYQLSKVGQFFNTQKEESTRQHWKITVLVCNFLFPRTEDFSSSVYYC